MREGECLGQWGPPLSLSSERVKDWSLSSRYPSAVSALSLSDQRIPARGEEFAVIELLGLL